MSIVAEVPLAERLLDAAGLPRGVSGLHRLAGGRNNRVWRLERDGQPPLVLKQYHHDPADPRDRLGAEWAFLQHAWGACGLRNVPQPLARDGAAHAGLYGFLPGRRPAAEAIGAAEVAAAAAFVLALNRPGAGGGLPDASEACFSTAAHAAMVGRRVARLAAGIDPAAPLAEAAAALVQRRLLPAWAALAPALAADEAASPRCVSPSDFGFHNALADAEGAIGFLDFEYAGHDDPAKLVCDFCCQPEVPVGAALHDAFRDSVLEGLGLDGPAQRARCAALLPAYRLKWACIALNDFLPAGAARRDFAIEGGREARCAAQLVTARRMLDSL